MISLRELNPHSYPTTEEIDKNLTTLLECMNQVRTLWAKPMIVTSGLRSQEDQARINPQAPKSKHLLGQAVDISDPDGSLSEWVEDNVGVMIRVGLWMEDFDYTKGWVHFQCVPPLSGKRFFIP